MSGSTAWTASPIYDKFSERLELFDAYYLRSTILKRIMTKQAFITKFSIEAVEAEFDQFWKDCDSWYYDVTARSERFRNVHFALQRYIEQAIIVLELSYRQTIKCLRLPFYQSAYLMFGVHEDDIERCAPDGWLFSGGASKTDSMNCMHYWLDMVAEGTSPFLPKAKGKWFKYLRAYAAEPGSMEGVFFHTAILKSGSYMWALTNLARELDKRCEVGGKGVDINGDLRRRYEDVCYPLAKSETMNFKRKTEDFQPSEIIADQVKLEYREVTVTDKRFENLNEFRPDKMELTPNLMAYLKLLVMENYGELDWDGDTPDHNKFPENFYRNIGAGIQRIGDRRLITFKGRTLDNAKFVVTRDFEELWDDEAGLSAEVTEETQAFLLAARSDQMAAAKLAEMPVTLYAPPTDPLAFVRGGAKKTDDNTMTYVVVGACLVAAIFFLNR